MKILFLTLISIILVSKDACGFSLELEEEGERNEAINMETQEEAEEESGIHNLIPVGVMGEEVIRELEDRNVQITKAQEEEGSKKQVKKLIESLKRLPRDAIDDAINNATLGIVRSESWQQSNETEVELKSIFDSIPGPDDMTVRIADTILGAVRGVGDRVLDLTSSASAAKDVPSQPELWQPSSESEVNEKKAIDSIPSPDKMAGRIADTVLGAVREVGDRIADLANSATDVKEVPLQSSRAVEETDAGFKSALDSIPPPEEIPGRIADTFLGAFRGVGDRFAEAANRANEETRESPILQPILTKFGFGQKKSRDLRQPSDSGLSHVFSGIFG